MANSMESWNNLPGCHCSSTSFLDFVDTVENYHTLTERNQLLLGFADVEEDNYHMVVDQKPLLELGFCSHRLAYLRIDARYTLAM